MLSLQPVAFSLVVLIFTYIGVHLLRGWALRNQVIDAPNRRSSHTRLTPRGGGLVIVVTTTAAWLPSLFLKSPSPPSLAMMAYVVGAGAIAAVSWRDDISSLPNWLRFAVHSAAAFAALLAIGYWQAIKFPVVGSVEVGKLGFPMTFLWIVGLTNAYNFMDGIDGLAGGQAVIAGLSWTIIGALSSNTFVMSLSLFAGAASLGFLLHNWPPARIFMGDVGSAFLGYTFAVLPLLLSPADDSIPLAAVLIVWPFIFDTTFTLLRRLINGEDIFAAHRSHLYQRLIICGYSHENVTLLYLALALLNAVLGIWWTVPNDGNALIVMFTLVIESLLLWRFVVGQEKKGPSARI